MTLIFDSQAPESDFEWGIYILNDLLLQTNTTGVNLLERIYSHALPRGAVHAEPLDPLMHILGFDEDTQPDVSYHQFSSSMGTFFETLVKNIFAFQRPQLFNEDWQTFCKENKLPWKPGQGKRFGDFRIGDTVIELKYRYASGESKDWQGRCAQRLRKIGKTPVMLILRPSRNADTMRSQGWDVYEGQDAIAYIEKHTNINLVRLAHACRINPLVNDHTTFQLERYRDRWSANATAMVLSMDLEHQVEHLQALMSHIPDTIRNTLFGESAPTSCTPIFTSRRKKPACPSPTFSSSRASA